MKARVPHRRGVTLYEVVLSLAILLGSMVVLGQLVSTGSRAAVQARLRTQATLLCESKMSEAVLYAQSGVSTAASDLPATFDGEAPDSAGTGRWVWSLNSVAGGSNTSAMDMSLTGSSSLPHADLIHLEVTVSHVAADETVDATASLSRYIRNPAVFQEAAEEAALLEQEAAAEE